MQSSLFAGASAEVLDKTAGETLAMVVAQRRVQDEAAARELVAVTHWADLHRAPDVPTPGDPEGLDPDATSEAAVVHRDLGIPVLGREGVLWLAGEGVFGVEEFAVCQLATALGVSEPSARRYLGEALELRERLPRLWDRVQSGQLPVWKARQVAAETIPLNAAAAAYVDAHLAPFAARMSLRRILRAVHAAVVRHDHQLATERAAKAAEGRGVWVDDDLDGTSRITAVTTTPDAAVFDAALDTVAAALETLGSTAPVQVRRATAVGILADPQHALDLHTLATQQPQQPAIQESAAPQPAQRRPARPRRFGGPTIHIHLHTDAITGTSCNTDAGGGLGPVARVQGLGPRTLATVQQWLTGLAPGAVIKLTPVVDLTEHIAVDAYEVPDRLRTQIEHRDHGCRFPWCGNAGRFDADHIEEYVPMDKDGPPEQTNSHNLARLCRFHHRVKTHTNWRYRQLPDGTLRWTSPAGHHFTVDEHGTTTHD